MNIATLLVALIATSAADTNGDPVLLDFTATWCPPCQQMKPAVEKLVEMGYPVKKVDFDRSPELVERYKVTAVPTFVVVDARGKILARSQGLMPASQLAAFYNKAKLKAAADEPPDDAEARDEPATAPTEAQAVAAPINPNPWETVVRIRMHLSDRLWGYGSGTVIYSSAEESIILTCAHIFKGEGGSQPTPKNFRVPISVDLFGSEFVSRQPATLACTQRDLPGEAIDYDFTHDVGLIRIRPGRKLPSARVVPTQWQPKKGFPMTTVGCSHGEDATAWSTTILDPRIAMSNTQTKKSFATIKCAYQPKEGRSGGGLFTSDGYVAGVCDFADPSEKVGLYAVPEAIHRLLDKNQLTALYKAPAPGGADVQLASSRVKARPSASTGTKVRAQNPEEDITLPHPSLAGINAPPGNARPWRSRLDDRSAPGGIRRPTQPEVALAEPVDRGARPGEVLTTDQTSEPGPEARSLHDADEQPPAPAPVTPPARAAANRSKASGWRPVRKPSADQDGYRPSAP